MLYEFIETIRRNWHSDIARQTQCELSLLCDLYGSDKGSIYGGGAYYKWPAHTYTPVYEYFFSPIRQTVKQVFECGLGTNNPALASSMGITGQPGASLRVWRDYFPNANIVGADIDRDILFSEERIYTGYINQLSPDDINAFFKSVSEKYTNKFDVMIDDGLHTMEAATCLFENAFNYLSNGGLYFIEDMSMAFIPKFKEYFETCKHSNQIVVKYMLMSRNRHQANNLIIIHKK
jgi:hypothetical protein